LIAVHKVIINGVGSILPSGLQRLALDSIFAIGRAQLSESVLNESNPLGSSRLAKLRHIFEEGKSLQLQFPAEDLGFRYHCLNMSFSTFCIAELYITIIVFCSSSLLL
jgi:hypothetical protein